MKTVAIVDYGMGNLRSVAKAVEHVAPGASVLVTADPAVVGAAERVIVPGQGAMPDCMRELDARGLAEAVVQAAAEKPFLGICIGLQMLFEHSEEGDVAGLGIFPGRVRRFPEAAMHDAAGVRLKVPHMGWNKVVTGAAGGAMFAGLDGAYFYFAHSYAVRTPEPSLVAGVTRYGGDVVAAVARHTVWGVQFHPEKSSTAGELLLRNFLRAARADGQREGRA